MRTRLFAIALGLASCARPPSGGSYEEPPLASVGSNEQLTVVVVQDFGMGEVALAELTDGNSLFLIGELSPRLNPLRGRGTLVIIATPTRARWFLRPLTASTEWNLYPATVEYAELHVRAFTRWVLITDEDASEPSANAISAPDTQGELPATVEVRTPKNLSGVGGDVYAHLFLLE